MSETFTGFFNYTGYLIDNYLASFILNISILVILSLVSISILNNSIFNPEILLINIHENILENILEKKPETISITQEEVQQKVDNLISYTRLSVPNGVSFDKSLTMQNDYEYNLDNPRLTKPKPGSRLIIPLGHSGAVLSTDVPANSSAVFEM